MSKNTIERVADRDHEPTVADETSKGRPGLLAILVILTVVGIVVWLVISQEETG